MFASEESDNAYFTASNPRMYEGRFPALFENLKKILVINLNHDQVV
jgi:hypothetical protein